MIKYLRNSINFTLLLCTRTINLHQQLATDVIKFELNTKILFWLNCSNEILNNSRRTIKLEAVFLISFHFYSEFPRKTMGRDFVFIPSPTLKGKFSNTLKANFFSFLDFLPHDDDSRVDGNVICETWHAFRPPEDFSSLPRPSRAVALLKVKISSFDKFELQRVYDRQIKTINGHWSSTDVNLRSDFHSAVVCSANFAYAFRVIKTWWKIFCVTECEWQISISIWERIKPSRETTSKPKRNPSMKRFIFVMLWRKKRSEFVKGFSSSRVSK